MTDNINDILMQPVLDAQVMSQIRRMRREFIGNTGQAPDTMYLGEQQFRSFIRANQGEQGYTGTLSAPLHANSETPFEGMTVYLVMVGSHIYICRRKELYHAD